MQPGENSQTSWENFKKSVMALRPWHVLDLALIGRKKFLECVDTTDLFARKDVKKAKQGVTDKWLRDTYSEIFPNKSTLYYFAFAGSTALVGVGVSFIMGRGSGIIASIATGVLIGDAQVSSQSKCSGKGKVCESYQSSGNQTDICSKVKEFQNASNYNHFKLWAFNSAVCALTHFALDKFTTHSLYIVTLQPLTGILSFAASTYVMSRVMDYRQVEYKPSEDKSKDCFEKVVHPALMCRLESWFIGNMQKDLKSEAVEKDGLAKAR